MIQIKVTGFDGVKRQLGAMAKQANFALSRALNETAKRIQQATYEEMRKQFDRPTPYALRSIAIKRSTKADLTAIVGLRSDTPGKGMSWEKSLGHQFSGGDRRWRKFEGALNKAGILPNGMAAVPPRESSWAIRLDQYGNVPRGLIVILLSYFQAFGEQGYKANSTDESRRRRAKLGRTASGYRIINGVQYFVVLPGRPKVGHFSQPGIYARRGIHGVDVAPVLLFVRRPSYQRRIDLERIARSVVAKDLNDIFNRELQAALASAR